MELVTLNRPTDSHIVASTELAGRLRSTLEGEVRFDPLSRTIYATDASIYQIFPAGVVLPKSIEDVIRTVRLCRESGVPVIARGAGTGLSGGAIGEGIALDLSRHLNKIGVVDVSANSAAVDPGVVLDELNHVLAAHGLQFAPDVATASRATIGGMIANNSCGAHSILHGRTVDHVRSLRVVLGDGELVEFQRPGTGSPPAGRAGRIVEELRRIRDDHYDEIQRRFPKVARNTGGYGLDRLGPPGTPIDVTKVLCGSEGTLGIVVGATLDLVPLPRCRALLVLHYDDVSTGLRAVPDILRHSPAAVELIDGLIIAAGRSNPSMAAHLTFLQGNPGAVLAVEFFADDRATLTRRVQALAADPAAVAGAFAVVPVFDDAEQKNVWDLRKAGLGLLMSRPGDSQPYAFVEDTAVEPARLAEYIERFQSILARTGVHAGYYAHAGAGCIHVKPVINLKTAAGVETMRRIAEEIVELALEFGGAVSGEHGDGIVRSCWIEKTYGPRIVEAFRRVKQLFDPDGILNPHKIVDPWPMTERLRYGPDFQQHVVRTALNFDEWGGPAGLAGMCTGVGQCRQRLVGTMCPSFVAIGDEKHTTRARANALRTALSDRGLLKGLDDPRLAEVMDLCISCKACKTECPTGVDMARLKAEFLFQRNLRHGASRRARLLADLPQWLSTAARFPRGFNLLNRSAPLRRFFEYRYGLDSRMAFPRLATETFRRWFRKHRRRNPNPNAPRGRVAYFVDTWTNYFTPAAGKAAVRLLEAAGYHVLCPPTVCCGRPAISAGLLAEARVLAEFNVDALSQLVDEGIPIVGTEPSCVLTMADEYPALLPSSSTDRLAARAMMIESFLADCPELIAKFTSRRASHPRNAPNREAGSGMDLIYHAHCHQKALVGTAAARSLLNAAFGGTAMEIDSGCCGMAGAFGHEAEHYEVARAIGEHRLFPAIRNRGNAAVAVSGFSCRTQIEHHTAAPARHLMEFLADRLGDG